MPICKPGGRTSASAASKSRASSSVGGRSRASTVAPDENTDDEGATEGEFVFLRDPSKMHKHEIQACFMHWMGRQEQGKIGFEFSHVLNAREGTLWPVIRLEELSDLGDTESDAPPPPPRNAPKRRRGKKQAKSRHGRTETAIPAKKRTKQKQSALATEPIIERIANAAGPSHPGGPPPALPAGLLQLDWDPMVDPMLQKEPLHPGLHARPSSGPTFMMGAGSESMPAVIADPEYAGYLAGLERGGAVMAGVVPAWMLQTEPQQPANEALRPAIRQYGRRMDNVTAADVSRAEAPTGIDSTFSAESHPLNQDTAIHETHLANMPMLDATPSGGGSDSPVPDYTKRWMRTRSRSRPRNADESPQMEQLSEVRKPAMGKGTKQKRGQTDTENSDRGVGGSRKKAKLTMGVEGNDSHGDRGRRPKPRPRVQVQAGIEGSDTFDLRHRRTA